MYLHSTSTSQLVVLNDYLARCLILLTLKPETFIADELIPRLRIFQVP